MDVSEVIKKIDEMNSAQKYADVLSFAKVFDSPAE